MKGRAFIFCLLVLLSLCASQTFGQCSQNHSFTNRTAPGSYWTGFSNNPAAGEIGGVSYVVGKGNPAPGQGVDSGIYPMTAGGCERAMGCQARLFKGDLRVGGSTAQGPGAWDSCPDPTGDNITVVMWERVGEGSASHFGQFVAATAKYAGTAYAFSAPMSPANGKVFMKFPTPEVLEAKGGANGTLTCVLKVPTPGGFPNNTAFKKQYFDATIGQPPAVVTGWDIYFVSAPKGAAPTSGDIASGGWVFVGTAEIPNDGQNFVRYTTPAIPAAGQPVYFAVAPRFADGFKPFTTYSKPYSGFFVGPNSAKVPPPGSKAPAVKK